MRKYRNDSYAPVTLATDPPCTVEPGWTVETDDVHIAGLTEIDDAGEALTPVAGEPGAEPVGTSDPALPLHRCHLEPPADWPADVPPAPTGDPAAHELTAATPVNVAPDAGEPGPTSPAGDAPADTSE